MKYFLSSTALLCMIIHGKDLKLFFFCKDWGSLVKLGWGGLCVCGITNLLMKFIWWQNCDGFSCFLMKPFLKFVKNVSSQGRFDTWWQVMDYISPSEVVSTIELLIYLLLLYLLHCRAWSLSHRWQDQAIKLLWHPGSRFMCESILYHCLWLKHSMSFIQFVRKDHSPHGKPPKEVGSVSWNSTTASHGRR